MTCAGAPCYCSNDQAADSEQDSEQYSVWNDDEDVADPRRDR